MKTKLLGTMLLLITLETFSQDSLYFEDAVLLALANNKLIQIAENNTEIAEEQAIPGRAGLLPTVNATGSANYAVNNTKIQVTNSPDVISTKGADQTNVQAAVNLNYTIFSGLSNKYRYELLKQGVELAGNTERQTAENIILQVASAYFNVLRTEANLRALVLSLEASQRRYERAEARFELAGGNSLEMLSAKVDLNQDSTLYLNAESAVAEARFLLNQLTGQAIETRFNYGDLKDHREQLLLDDLLSDALAQNSQIINNRLATEQSMLNYKIAKSAYLPRLDLISSYSYSNSQTEGSFLQLNQSDGLGTRLSLTIPIFTGGVNNSNVRIQEINRSNAELQVKELESQIEAQVRAAFVNYLNAIRIRNMEEANIEVAEKNFEYSRTLFEQGTINSVVFREAQVNLLLARNGFINSRYNAKLAELELLRLSGNLLQAFGV